MAPRAARRDQLAAIAADLFARQGYHAVSVNDIAAAAGLSGPAIYRHFPGKQAVLACVLLGSLDRLATDADAHMGADAADPYGALAAATIAHPEFGVLWRRERRHLAPEDAALAAERMGQVERVLKTAIGAARPELSAADADLLAWAVLSVYGSIADHRVRIPGPRFEALLAEIAADVAATVLPAADGRSPERAGPRRGALRDPPRAAPGRRGPHVLGPRIPRGHHGGHRRRRRHRRPLRLHALRGQDRPAQDRRRPHRGAPARGDGRDPGRRAATGPRPCPGWRPASPRWSSTTATCSAPISRRATTCPTGTAPSRGATSAPWSTTGRRSLEAAVPGMPGQEARLRVHAAFAVANDLARTRKVAGRADLGSDVRVLMDSVLRGRR